MDLSLFRGGVAVITGGASGLGLAMGRKARSLGMHLVLADLRKDALDRTVAELEGCSGGRVVGVMCDVTSLDSVGALLAATRSAFPGEPIQFVAANAGVFFAGSTILGGSAEDWERTMRANVLGVFHTLRTFGPVLLAQPQKSLIEITASIASLMPGSVGPYGPSKHAVLAMAEALHGELSVAKGEPLDRMSIVALCPSLTNTSLMDSTAEQAGVPASEVRTPPERGTLHSLMAFDRQNWEQGLTPEFVAEEVFRHAAEGKFYCILQLEDGRKTNAVEAVMRARLDHIVHRQQPAKL